MTLDIELPSPAELGSLVEVRGWRRYPAYKDSGVPWLGEVPSHWQIRRMKHLVSQIGSGKTPRGGSQVYVTSGVMLLRSQNVHFAALRLDDVAFIDDEADCEMAGTRVLPEDVLLNITGASLGRCCVVPTNFGRANVNQHVCILRSRPRVVAPAYLHYLLRSHVLQAQIHSDENGSSREGLNFQQVGNLIAVLPPPDEQRSILVKVMRETAKIDALVEKKRRLLGLIEEKRAALISHAVTKGLDPTAPMKDSGVEWLGQVPAHWELRPLMRLTPDDRQIMYGIVLPGPSVSDGVPIVKGGDVAPGRLRPERLQRTTTDIDASHARSRLRGGDIVYAIRGSIGAVQPVPDELTGANLTQDAARISPRPDVDRQWLLHTLRSRPVFAQLDARATGATIRGINIRDLKRAVIPVPCPQEQRSISAHLDKETATLDKLAVMLLRHVKLLGEYRTALISAAVTGKIDVREA